jgi:hypothetical protein
MKSFIKKLMGTKTYPDIKSIKPFTKIEGVPKYQKEIIKARGNVQKKFGSVNEGIKNETRQLRNVLQKMRGEKVTKSGISKGKDVTPGVYKPLKDKKKTDLAKGGRVGLKEGSPKKKKKLDQGDILGNRFDKKFKKYALSKEAQLHAKDYDEGIDRGERRAANEVAQEAGLPTMNKGGRVGLKRGTGLMRRKSNIQKIQETFGPKKKLSTKQMKIAKQAGDPNKIEGVDFKKLQQKRRV